MSENSNVILISGLSTTGKSACLEGLKNQERVMYLNTECNKKLPFKDQFKYKYTISDPLQVEEAFEFSKTKDDLDTIIVDSVTFLMDMYETMHVLTSSNTQKAWGDYQQFFKRIMQTHVAQSNKNVIFTGHTKSVLNENTRMMETQVTVKGALQNTGIESYFTNVVSTKRMSLKDLEKYKNPLLTITEEEEILGYKYVFQTKITKETVGERIRSPKGMWSTQETFIDNNAQFLLDRLHKYYN